MLDCNLKYEHDGFALDVQFQMQHPIMGLIGDSGHGKSTLLKLISGLLTPCSGHIVLNDQMLYHDQHKINVAVHKRQIALIFQKAWIFPHLSVAKNLSYAEKMKQKSQQKFSFEQIVELLQLGSLLNRKSHQLSGGEAQRVSIGRALLSSPDLLLLDEPLTGLDRILKDQLLFFLHEVIQETQVPMIYVTHHHKELDYLNAEIYRLVECKLR
ncbi:ATP-binding cassette domain-containing protein [Acinetobacter sp. 194]|uniref:ATP-binding cassette domain-containing protein n=1 Tax=Acinetobacter shaoyimingii TaxID=2715164 RepID=UPI0014087656|nr:ATP-binding cassette domain-containing protein [Acinetobacter shaoyimingii]NHB58528.1 ATP-binding cassette domain-containing protein [Acinetobacter shaoyimingii]